MHNLYRFFLLLFLTTIPLFNASAQSCSPAAIANLDWNNVRATLPQGGALWWDFNDGGYIVPKDNINPVAAIFAGGLWFGAIDPAGFLRVSATTYNTPPEGSSGPLINGQPDFTTCANFDRHWVVNQSTIDLHLADFSDNGVIDNPESEIMAWPGRGNASSVNYNGFDLPDIDLAPFFDANANGIYEPLSGEYPLIKGDEAVWWIYNSGTAPANFISPDIQTSIMAYSFATNDVLNLTTFYDVKFTNAGVQPLDSAFVGLWVDADLGCFVDDFIGCSPEHNLSYVYNADAIDGDPQCIGIPSYGDEVPILGIKLLKGASDADGNDLGLSSFVYYNNASIGLPPSGTTDPSTDFDYYNYLNGRWRDGSPLVDGGDGYTGGNNETKYVFPDNPSDPQGWSMCSAALPVSDRRTVMNSGPFYMQPGQSNDISFAVIFIEDQPHPCPDITPMLDACEIVQETFDNPTSVGEYVLPKDELLVFPNPFSETVKISTAGALNLQDLFIYTVDGKLLKQFNAINAAEFIFEKGSLPNGMYMYKARLENGQMAVGKLIAE